MNILQIKIGNYYDSDYAEFIYHTNLSESDFYDCDFKLTKWFRNWLIEHNKWLLDQIDAGRLDDIFYYSNESIDVITKL